jgi:hypothetical protein
LAAVVERWADLPLAVRESILMLVRAALPPSGAIVFTPENPGNGEGAWKPAPLSNRPGNGFMFS